MKLNNMIEMMLKMCPEIKDRMDVGVKECFIEILEENKIPYEIVDNEVRWDIPMEHPYLPDSVRMYREDVLFPDNMPDDILVEYSEHRDKVEEQFLLDATLRFFKKEGVA